jgi:hypothetical protein
MSVPLHYVVRITLAGGTIVHDARGMIVGTYDTAVPALLGRAGESLATAARVSHDRTAGDFDILRDGRNMTLTIQLSEAR